MLSIDRRSLIRGGALGLGALALPGSSRLLAQVAAARGFTHNVASGEPQAESVLLWTRFVPANGDSARVTAELSETADFARPVSGGTVVTGPWRDWTAKTVIGGLKPGRPYFYRFTADGQVSPIGRTKTLPEGATRSFRIGVFSCSNLPFGWFNAYAHAAARDDIDLALHLGDYIYEYGTGTYPSTREVLRPLEPATEIIALADYRLRYACYRADPDLQALHARVPMLVQWDDHESTNDSWEGGAGNHDPATEGLWSTRRAAAMQAWREWMPVSEAPWAAYDLGDLGTYFRTESRLIGRSEPPDLGAILNAGGDPVAALRAFRDGAWQDPARTMLGPAQEQWLASALARSVRERRAWQVVGFGTILGETRTPARVAEWLDPAAPDFVRDRLRASLAAAQAGMPYNMDNWGGYPAARSRFLQSAQAAGADLVALAGDSHNAWGFELGEGGRAAGVEFAGHSVTSPGYESFFRTARPADMATALVATNPELKWADTSGRGYMTLTLTPEAATGEWLFVDTIRERSPRVGRTHRMRTAKGRRRLEVV